MDKEKLDKHLKCLDKKKHTYYPLSYTKHEKAMHVSQVYCQHCLHVAHMQDLHDVNLETSAMTDTPW